jgi:hypothetical protein
METFTARSTDKHPTDLAMLPGARLVSASETEEGRPWAEARIKQITGGDPITARLIVRTSSPFNPKFKLVIIGNHEPVLRNVDVRRRDGSVSCRCILCSMQPTDRRRRFSIRKLRQALHASRHWHRSIWICFIWDDPTSFSFVFSKMRILSMAPWPIAMSDLCRFYNARGDGRNKERWPSARC